MPTESHAGTVALRTALRELVALSTIPAAWVGREPPIIAAGLADVLVGSLHLDFAFVRLCDPKGGAAIVLLRLDRKFTSSAHVLHGFDAIEHEVHQYLLQLHT